MSEEDKLKTNNEKVTINDYYYYYLLKCENTLNELEKDIKNLYTYGIKNNAEQRDYLLNRLEGLKELKEDNKDV